MFKAVNQLSCFCALCFGNVDDEVVILIFIMQRFSWNNSPISFCYSSLSSCETFWSICDAVGCKR